MDTSIYFAGGFYLDPQGKKGEKVFENVKPSGEGALPYITHDPKGLWLTSHHANLFRLSEDGRTAIMEDCRNLDVGQVHQVALSERQREDLKKAIEADNFYD